MVKQQQWPRKNKDNVIRLYCQNLNSISYLYNCSKWDIIVEKLYN